MQIDLVSEKFVTLRRNAKYIQRCQLAALCIVNPWTWKAKNCQRSQINRRTTLHFLHWLFLFEGKITSVYSGYSLFVQGLKNKE